MRGVLYRTEADGETPLAKPELKVSATKHNRVAYYENEDVKNEAFENGDLKEGMIVMTAEDDLSKVSAVPVATIIASASDAAPSGYLLCDGNQYSQTQYPALYLAIGNKYNKEDTSAGYFCVPDLRELVLVGSGQNEKETIEDHDVFELGEFKDDQLQNITGSLSRSNGTFLSDYAVSSNGALYVRTTGITSGISTSGTGSAPRDLSFDASRVARAGTTTRTKQFGVNYFIKAISGELVQDDSITVNNIMRNIYPDWSKSITVAGGDTAVNYTTKEDGLYICTSNSGGSTAGYRITVNGINVAGQTGSDGLYIFNTVPLYLKAGSTIVIPRGVVRFVPPIAD